MDEREVDQQQPARQEQHVGLECDAVGEGAGDEGRRDDREHHLVGDEHDRRDRVVEGRRRLERDAAQERQVEIADDAALAAAEAQRVADNHPEDCRPAHRDVALDHDSEHVATAHEPAVEEGQARGHQHHQAAAEQHECGVAGIETKHRSSLPMCGSRARSVRGPGPRGYNSIPPASK